jgi:hypothetical protein
MAKALNSATLFGQPASTFSPAPSSEAKSGSM